MRTLSYILFALLLAGLHAQSVDLCSDFLAKEAITDYSVSVQQGGQALYLFNTSFTAGNSRFVFLGSAGLEVNSTTQTATLRGRLVTLANSNDGFDLILSVALLPNAAGMGMNELVDSVSVDMTNWIFFTVVSPSSLTGFGAFQGTTLTITQQMDNMPMQVGIGANGKNLNFGAAVWLNIWSGDYHIAADVNIDLNCTTSSSGICPGGNMIASAASDDSYATTTGGSAFSFFNAPSQIGAFAWVFDSNGGVLVSNNGQLHLTGTIVPLDASLNLDRTFYVNLLFRSPSADELAAIQAMTPHLELNPSAYIAQNGPVNPASWSHYFIDTDASAITDSANSVRISLSTQMGMPLQVGIGANGKNILFGASGWFDYTLTSQSNAFAPISGAMDINIDLNCTSASTPTPVPDSDCSMTVSATLRTQWQENDQTITLWDISVTNTGSKAITDATFQIDYPTSLGCAAGACIRQSWNLNVDADGVFHLPSWLTDWNGLASKNSFMFGIISSDTNPVFSGTPICRSS